MTRVRKAVIPAAGLGTRFLPATKSSPKEMLPVVDKPAIQYVVEEAVRAGIDDIIIITGRSKRSLEDHFDRNVELELELEQRGRLEALEEVRALADLADIFYVRQGEPLGLGHAVSICRKHIGDNPFVVLLGDDLIDERLPLLEGMIETYERLDSSVIALMEVENPSLYGCARAEPAGDNIVRIRDIVEKPSPA
ncbi:MAG: UTP--glucose-phosphate uridylyltransferase, partial [Actinomycetota bacterium]|nr:UTP--glucose-phosphate uridylyltransferase [Actinomycetota bacterium]